MVPRLAPQSRSVVRERAFLARQDYSVLLGAEPQAVEDRLESSVLWDGLEFLLEPASVETVGVAGPRRARPECLVSWYRFLSVEAMPLHQKMCKTTELAVLREPFSRFLLDTRETSQAVTTASITFGCRIRAFGASNDPR